jgi:hypothetical protein
MPIVAGKYVPPHMRNGAKIEPTQVPATPAFIKKTTKPKNYKKSEKNYSKNKNVKKTEIIKKQPKEEGPQVKPHCELFLADLPPALRSRQFLAGFFHPYGEITQITYVPAGSAFPADMTRRNLFNPVAFVGTNCAVIEFMTARVAKFVVGVLRKRIEGLNFRIGLLKPGLADEMVVQKQRLLDVNHMPALAIAKTQSHFLENSNSSSQYSSEELSESEISTQRNGTSQRNCTTHDHAYYTGSSESYHTSDSYDTSDDDTDLLTLALKNGIKVIRD